MCFYVQYCHLLVILLWIRLWGSVIPCESLRLFRNKNRLVPRCPLTIGSPIHLIRLNTPIVPWNLFTVCISNTLVYVLPFSVEEGFMCGMRTLSDNHNVLSGGLNCHLMSPSIFPCLNLFSYWFFLNGWWQKTLYT